MSKVANILAIEVQHAKLKYAVISENLDFLKQGNKRVQIDSKESVLDGYWLIADECRRDGLEIEGCSISMPGVIDIEKGYAYSGGEYLWVRNMEYAKEISEVIKMPVIICNDAKAAAFAEIGFGSLKGITNGVLMMIMGTGIGGAIIVDGHLLNGQNFAAGELSYMKGNYEVDNDRRDMFAFSGGINSLASLCSDDGGQVNTMKIMTGIIGKDPKIIKGVEEYCYRVATFIYNIQCVVDAKRFVIGGNITDEPHMVRMMQEAVDRKFENSLRHNIFKPEIKEVTFHANSRLYGSVYLYKHLKQNGWKM